MLVNIVKCKWKKNNYYSWRSLCDKKLGTKLKCQLLCNLKEQLDFSAMKLLAQIECTIICLRYVMGGGESPNVL